MAQKVIELRAKKAKAAADARAKLESITDAMPADQRATANTEVDRMLAEVDSLDAEIRRYETLENIESGLNEVIEQRAGREGTSIDEARDNETREERAFLAWMAGGMAGVPEELRSVMQGRQVRAQATGTGTAGGYTIPTGFRRKLEEAKKAFGGIRPLATILNTADGAPMPMPSIDNTAEEGMILDENTAATEDDIAFGTKQIDVHMYSSKLVRVPLQLLEDSAFSFDGFLPRMLVERIARLENKHYATGTGTGQPRGFLTDAPVVDTAAVGVLTWEDIVELMHAVDPAYRGAGAGFALSDNALKVVRKMKDAEGKPIWVESTRAGDPATIFGKPYAIVQEMPGVASGNKPIAFGDFKSYIIRDAGTPIMQRLVERFAEFLQVGFHNAERHGGGLFDAGGGPIKALRIRS